MLAAVLSFLIPSSIGILWLNPWVWTSSTPHLWTSMILRWWAQIQPPPWIKIVLFPLPHHRASGIGLQGETTSIYTFTRPGLYWLLGRGRKTLNHQWQSPPAQSSLLKRSSWLSYEIRFCRMKRLDVLNEQSCSPFLLPFYTYTLHSCPAELG